MTNLDNSGLFEEADKQHPLGQLAALQKLSVDIIKLVEASDLEYDISSVLRKLTVKCDAPGEFSLEVIPEYSAGINVSQLQEAVEIAIAEEKENG